MAKGNTAIITYGGFLMRSNYFRLKRYKDGDSISSLEKPSNGVDFKALALARQWAKTKERVDAINNKG